MTGLTVGRLVDQKSRREPRRSGSCAGATGGGHQADAKRGGRSDGRTATATACAKRRRARRRRSGRQLKTLTSTSRSIANQHPHRPLADRLRC